MTLDTEWAVRASGIEATDRFEVRRHTRSTSALRDAQYTRDSSVSGLSVGWCSLFQAGIQ